MRDFCVLSALTGFGGRPVFPARFYSRLVADYIIIISLFFFLLLRFKVRDLVENCSCPTQFPMIRVSEGKYRIGDTKMLIFVRVS